MAMESTGYGKVSQNPLQDKDLEVWSKAQRDKLVKGAETKEKFRGSPLGSQLPQKSEEGRSERIASRIPDEGIMDIEQVYAFADSMKKGKQKAAEYDVSELEKIVEIINRKNTIFNQKQVQLARAAGAGEAALEQMAPMYEVREGQIFAVDQDPVGPQPPQMAGPAQAPAAAPQALGGMGPMSNVSMEKQNLQAAQRKQIAGVAAAGDDGYGDVLSKTLQDRLRQR